MQFCLSLRPFLSSMLGRAMGPSGLEDLDDGVIVVGAILAGTAGTFAASGIVYGIGEAYSRSHYPKGGWQSSYWTTWGFSVAGLATGALISESSSGSSAIFLPIGTVMGAGIGYYLSFEAPRAEESTSFFLKRDLVQGTHRAAGANNQYMDLKESRMIGGARYHF